MFKNISCMKNKIFRTCKKIDLDILSHQLQMIQMNNDNVVKINLSLDKLYSDLKFYDINDLKKFDKQKISESEFDFDYYENIEKCKLDPQVCEINIRINKERLEKLNKETKDSIINIIYRYNKFLSVVYQVKDYYNIFDYESKNIYLKFHQDENNNLIALYFNIDTFINNGLSTIYLFSKYGDLLDKSILHIRYEDEYPTPYIKICDFMVLRRGIGHGSFMLSNVESIVKEINKIIKTKYDMKEVYKIKGILYPLDDEFREKLINFYNKNGYYVLDNYICKDLR